jgi:hypothetical protein
MNKPLTLFYRHISGIHESFYVMSTDRKIKLYSVPSVAPNPDKPNLLVQMGQSVTEVSADMIIHSQS